jgi:S-DNA-T family DNA segregation ATPase FtsK/SpoIIIE
MNPQKSSEDITYHFPPLSLLKERRYNRIDEQEVKENAMRIQQTLLNFGIRVQVSDINNGVRFTRYEIVPEMGVRIKEIVKRESEIRIATKATDIHIEAPIPGKPAIGIDIANKEVPIVTIKEIIESREFKESPSNMTFAVGRNIIGEVVVDDISKMPHLLIAGATGSGKTVCLSSIIMSMLYKAGPDSVKMIMIDTKGVSLSIYNGIPHLLIPVVTDASKSLAALEWVRLEVEDRYRKFAEFGVRDLAGYNKSDRVPCKTPQILVLIDDLSDLMAIYKSEAEQLITRIAQSSRGAGVHFVIATQRPSTDVITGLIKANIPSRMACSVFSAIDSRVILDERGAELLLGNGDMLFKPQGCMKPIRIQGAYISDEEIENVVHYLKNQTISTRTFCDIKNIDKCDDDYDPYFVETGRFIIDKGKASIGMIQRMFKIGFNRAARIMDQLCAAGVVAEEDGTKPRTILMSMEEFEKLVKEMI